MLGIFAAVETSAGPHVTPLLFAATPDRLWFGIGPGTLKARVLAKSPAVGVVVSGSENSIAIRGQATLLDRLPASPSELARAPFALPAFASRNALEMAAFARDVTMRGGRRQALAPLSVRIDTIDVLDGWAAHAVLGWATPGGPIALPARWDARTSRARAPAEPAERESLAAGRTPRPRGGAAPAGAAVRSRAALAVGADGHDER